MNVAAALLLLTGAFPISRAWWTHRRTPLVHALTWAALAWIAWEAAILSGQGGARYVALCLTGCAGIAVLGARRPGAGAWNFVVAGLLVVLLLPLAEGFGRLELSLPRLLFLAGTLAVSFLNYLPTRLFPSALLLAAGCGVELASLVGTITDRPLGVGRLALAAAPWAAFLLMKRHTLSEFDRTWRSFRDGFGALWAQRMREQFNRAAANAGLTGRLAWDGLHGAPEAEREQQLLTLRALLKRFGPPD
jgi:hypothetical protein